jgi:hypothetical protein
MRFRLVHKTTTAANAVFHITNARGDICGSVNVAPGEVNDLRKCWAGAYGRPAAKPGVPVVKLPQLGKAAILKRLLSMSTGIRAMIDAAVWFEDQFGMETIALGRSAVDDADCALEIGGAWLLFRIALHGDEIRTAATLMDGDGTYQTLLRSRDDEVGWQTARRLCSALERHAVKSLTRPIAVGEPGDPDAWLIA